MVIHEVSNFIYGHIPYWLYLVEMVMNFHHLLRQGTLWFWTNSSDSPISIFYSSSLFRNVLQPVEIMAEFLVFFTLSQFLRVFHEKGRRHGGLVKCYTTIYIIQFIWMVILCYTIHVYLSFDLSSDTKLNSYDSYHHWDRMLAQWVIPPCDIASHATSMLSFLLPLILFLMLFLILSHPMLPPMLPRAMNERCRFSVGDGWTLSLFGWRWMNHSTFGR